MANLRANRITSTEVFETTGSVQFDGSGDALNVSSSDDFSFGTGDFTVEAWVLANAYSGSHQVISITDGTENWQFFRHSGGTLRWNSRGTGDGATVAYNADEDLEIGTWHHIAATRNNNTLRLFKNGILVGTFGGYTSDLTLSTSGPSIGIWDGDNSSEPWNGHISNVRVIKGKALYTANFTPPTRELEVIPNTVLLACQSTTKADEEKTGKTITINGNAVANELTPGLLTNVVKSGGSSAITGSVEFDGTGDYLSLADSDDFYFEDHKFTVECWTYTGLDVTSVHTILAQWGSGTDRNIEFDYRGDASKVWRFYYRTSSTTEFVSSIDPVEPNSWYHLAAVADGTNLKLYVNGVLQETNAIAGNAQNSTDNFLIGTYQGTLNYYNGFISNLRVIKGTALYTSNFIPPTRKLTKLPGTVLLCCQDSNDPTTEATGKTITGYGNLEQDPPELVTDGGFDSAANWSSAGADWTISGGVATISSADSGYDFLGNLTSSPTNGLLYELTFDISNWTVGRLELAQSDSGNRQVSVTGNGSYTYRWTYTGTTNGNISLYAYTGSTSSFTLDNVSLKRVSQKRKGSDFTPSVGSDDSVEFAGPTTINTENYFYLPTGPTEQRASVGNYNAGTRGIFGGGFSTPSTHHDTIQFITIASTGDATDFGTLTESRFGNAALSDSTRAIWAGGVNPTPSYFNTIDYVTIMSGGAAQDFGDLYSNVYYPAGVSNATRGVWSGGYQFPSPSTFRNDFGYVTIASKGDSQDFGDLATARNSHSSFSSPTRGVFAGGASPTKINSIEYITISSTGSAQDFGDLTVARNYAGGCSNVIRGLVGGGSNPSVDNTIDYVTIQSTGNATDFGDLTSARAEIGSCSSATRGVFAGAWSPSQVNTIDYVQIMTTGNAQTFGELVNIGVMQEMGTSNGHGGLG